MKVEKLLEIIGADFYTGVPDSQLKALCNYLMNKYGIENFTFELLERVQKNDLSTREKYWIDFYGSNSYGLNEKAGG